MNARTATWLNRIFIALAAAGAIAFVWWVLRVLDGMLG